MFITKDQTAAARNGQGQAHGRNGKGTEGHDSSPGVAAQTGNKKVAGDIPGRGHDVEGGAGLERAQGQLPDMTITARGRERLVLVLFQQPAAMVEPPGGTGGFQGLFAKAVDEFKKAIQADPESSEAYQHLGDAFYKLGQNEKAVEAYEKVKKRDPYNVDVLENLGVIFANRGDYKKAVWQWGEVLKKNPERRDIVERIRRMQRFIRQRSV